MHIIAPSDDIKIMKPHVPCIEPQTTLKNAKKGILSQKNILQPLTTGFKTLLTTVDLPEILISGPFIMEIKNLGIKCARFFRNLIHN